MKKAITFLFILFILCTCGQSRKHGQETALISGADTSVADTAIFKSQKLQDTLELLIRYCVAQEHDFDLKFSIIFRADKDTTVYLSGGNLFYCPIEFYFDEKKEHYVRPLGIFKKDSMEIAMFYKDIQYLSDLVNEELADSLTLDKILRPDPNDERDGIRVATLACWKYRLLKPDSLLLLDKVNGRYCRL